MSGQTKKKQKQFQSGVASNKPPATLRCKLFGHQWQGDSLKRTCLRCGKTQVARFVGNEWVDVDD